MSSLDIDGILVNTKELDRLRKEQEVVVLEINKMHKKLLASEYSFVLKAFRRIIVVFFYQFGVLLLFFEIKLVGIDQNRRFLLCCWFS